ncbi:hypothetical protein [Microbispora sp. NPDC046933]|uniref:hypothetical protein n=1 Tax=Microbispora sp. NPDC046933 TaxID=3155618 RepID=UPI0033F188E1
MSRKPRLRGSRWWWAAALTAALAGAAYVHLTVETYRRPPAELKGAQSSRAGARKAVVRERVKQSCGSA